MKRGFDHACIPVLLGLFASGGCTPRLFQGQRMPDCLRLLVARSKEPDDRLDGIVCGGEQSGIAFALIMPVGPEDG